MPKPTDRPSPDPVDDDQPEQDVVVTEVQKSGPKPTGGFIRPV